jgi:hypothetical protein
MLRALTVLASLGFLPLGCAEQRHLIERGSTGNVSPCSFWPPPPSSATWIVRARADIEGDALAAVAEKLKLSLEGAGYSDQLWYPIGATNSHGFAVTTKLERVDGGPASGRNDRWSPMYRDAVSLRWLHQARTPSLPGPGRYRTFLVSFSDLPSGKSLVAPIWNDETVMDWPDAGEHRSFRPSGASQPSSVDYRFGVYEYEYEWDEAEARGRFLPPEPGHEVGSPELPALLGQSAELLLP